MASGYHSHMTDEEYARQLQSDEIAHLTASERQAFYDSHQMNQTVQGNIMSGIREMREDSPRVLGCYICWALTELIASCVVLGLSWNKPCDRPLRWWVLLFSSRYLILVPLSILVHLARRDGNDGSRYNSYSNSVYLATFVWFVVGQVWTFSSDTCHSTNSSLYTYAVVLIILVYVHMALPILLLLAFCICLPCLLLVVRLFAEGQRGAPDDIVNSLPRMTFDARASSSNAAEDEEPPSCAVCQENYKDGDELRVLPCQHRFHIACVDPWLKLKRVCPLCRDDITHPRGSQV